MADSGGTAIHIKSPIGENWTSENSILKSPFCVFADVSKLIFPE